VFTLQNLAVILSNVCYFYVLQGNPYAMKEGTAGASQADMSAAAAWSSAAALQPTAGYYGYDHPTLAAYG
jgi:hypothetical protein